MSFSQTLFQYIDFLWIVIALIAVDKKQWLKAIGFILVCALALRLQVDIMHELRMPSGLLRVLDAPLFTRGLIVYGLFIGFYIWASKYYKRLDPIILLAASFTLFGMAFCISSFVMLL